jgi:N utilization substance protein B
MGKRHTARKVAIQALYQTDISSTPIKKSLEGIFEQESLPNETKVFATTLAEGTWKRKKEIDPFISKYSKGWKIERMCIVDRNILRLALFELLENKSPHRVVIDEAIELAKKFSTDEAAKFINGILGTYVKEQLTK